MRLPIEPDTPATINIVPMIDVIFAILTFFIMSTLFLNRTEGLPVNLPKSTTASAQTQSRIVITIDAQGKLALNRQPLELQELEPQLKQRVKAEGTVVVINADAAVNHGQFIAVMDQVRRVSGTKLAIATQRP